MTDLDACTTCNGTGYICENCKSAEGTVCTCVGGADEIECPDCDGFGDWGIYYDY